MDFNIKGTFGKLFQNFRSGLGNFAEFSDDLNRNV